jgi:hypothetical protein
MTEEEAAALRATEMFKLAERRGSDPPALGLSHHSSAHVAPPAAPVHSTRSTRSQSDDMNVYTTSGPLHYEEEELIEHRHQQSTPPLPPPHSESSHKASQRDEVNDELLTHSEEEEGEENGEQHHEL